MPPVEDHPVHELTRIGAEHRSGCHSMYGYQHLSGYWAKNGYKQGQLVWKWQEDNLSKRCRQTLYESLPGCQGCTREKDWEYLEKWKTV